LTLVRNNAQIYDRYFAFISAFADGGVGKYRLKLSKFFSTEMYLLRSPKAFRAFRAMPSQPFRRAFWWSPSAVQPIVPPSLTNNQLHLIPESSLIVDPTILEIQASVVNGVDLVVASENVLTAITHIGDLKSLGLCSVTSVSFILIKISGWIQQLVEYVHVYGQQPWWITIILSAIILRLALFPLAVKSQSVGNFY
jgi:hypothetical protein